MTGIIICIFFIPQNKEKCACWQLTMEGQKVIPGMDDAELNEGYIYRRLPERIVTGIYECNSRYGEIFPF